MLGVTLSEKGKTHTVWTCVSAAGNSIPPMMIYPHVRMAEHLKQNSVAGTLLALSKNMYMELHMASFKFLNHSIPAAGPVLLIQDGYSSHMSLDAIKLAQENDCPSTSPIFSHWMWVGPDGLLLKQ